MRVHPVQHDGFLVLAHLEQFEGDRLQLIEVCAVPDATLHHFVL